MRVVGFFLDRPFTRIGPILLFVCLLFASKSAVGGARDGILGNLQNHGNDLQHVQSYPQDNPTVQSATPQDPVKLVNDAQKDTGHPSPPMQDDCRPFAIYSTRKHAPFSSGAFNLSFQRPMPPNCRKFLCAEVEDTVERFKDVISDPDLYRLFENSYPNTVDTAVKFKGYARDDSGQETDEELTFVITGDINAMWLRDSANQLQSYLPLLKHDLSEDSLASLYRGVINLQSRYIRTSPYCNSFQAPEEANLKHFHNMGSDRVKPAYDPLQVWECKYELDSLAAFLQVSTNYYEKTDDHAFFRKYKWVDTVGVILNTAEAMRTPTRDPVDGHILDQPYTFTRASRWGDTLINGGKGSPVRGGTGLIRSAFRPSDDACIYQLFIPANMMFARYLESAAAIMKRIGEEELHNRMVTFSKDLRAAVEDWGVVEDKKFGPVYAYEIDGFGSVNMMDDANIPSLLSIPLFGYTNSTDATYLNTRRKLLSEESAYYSRGPVLNAMGSPHDGPGKGWPMARIVGIMTSEDDGDITAALRELVASTAGLGLIHESVNSFDQMKWTRQWFSWANGLFGQMILDLEKRKPHLLKGCFQPSCNN